MVRKGTWFLIIVLLALVGLSLFLQRQKANELSAPIATSTITPLFGAQLGEPSSIRIENASGDAVELARDADGKWVLSAPTRADADQAAAQAAATQAAALRSLATVRLAPAVVGLDKPSFTLTITFPGESSAHILLIGAATPIQDGYYAQLDGGAYRVVDKTGIEELIGLVKTPPYPATPTSAASTTPEASSTATLEGLTATSVPPTSTTTP